MGPENPLGNAFYEVSTLLRTEAEAQQLTDALHARYWKIVNPTALNGLGSRLPTNSCQAKTFSPLSTRKPASPGVPHS